MTRTLMAPHDKNCKAPTSQRIHACRGGRKILKTLWDENEGYRPQDPGYGYVVWGVRPYRLGDGWNGDAQTNALYLANHILLKMGVDLAAAYSRAYPDEPPLDFSDVADETEIPVGFLPDLAAWSLADLTDFNMHSLVDEIILAIEETGRGEIVPEDHAEDLPEITCAACKKLQIAAAIPHLVFRRRESDRILIYYWDNGDPTTPRMTGLSIIYDKWAPSKSYTLSGKTFGQKDFETLTEAKRAAKAWMLAGGEHA